MAKPRSIIFIQPEAPAKPAWGAVCNGCGVCCLAEPCPVGMVLSRRRTGACEALLWVEEERVYRCGALTEPKHILGHCLPRWMQFAKKPLAALLRKLAPRWISAGSGCDSTLEVASPSGTIPPNKTETNKSANS